MKKKKFKKDWFVSLVFCTTEIILFKFGGFLVDLLLLLQSSTPSVLKILEKKIVSKKNIFYIFNAIFSINNEKL